MGADFSRHYLTLVSMREGDLTAILQQLVILYIDPSTGDRFEITPADLGTCVLKSY